MKTVGCYVEDSITDARLNEKRMTLQTITNNIELWSTTKLVPYVRNPRKNDTAVDRMANSIQEFGFKIPVLARSTGEVVDGHLRLKAANKLGLAEVPVILCYEWTDAQVKAFRLMVNRSVEWAEWDEQLLSLELADLKALDFDLNLTGFDTSELDRYLAGVDATRGLTDEDDAPDLPQTPVSRAGELWLLGHHRLLCGDSTVATDVERLLNGVSPTLMATDPPYGVDYEPAWRAEAGVNRNRSKLGKVQNDSRADWREAWALFPGDVMYVWHAGIHAATVQQSIEACGFEVRSQIVWAKDRFALSRGNYHWQHEPCWYAVRNNAHWNGDRSQSTLWQIKAREDDGHGHGTQKPVECMRRPMLNNSSPGQVIYDPFLGSGTSVIAAETCGRICYGLEIDPRYCDVILERWRQFTGRQPKLDKDGRDFDVIAAERKREAA
jgi:DNA modification methylase